MDDRQLASAKALMELTQRQAQREGPSPEVTVEGQRFVLARWEKEGLPGMAAMSGAGGTKRVFDLGDGRALALPNIAKGMPARPEQAREWLTRWREVVESEAKTAAQLRALGFETQDYRLTEAKVGEGAIPALTMPSFAQLEQRGMQVKDTKFNPASRGSSMLFGSAENLKSPAYVEALMQGLVEDVARIGAYGLHIRSGDSYNIVLKDTARTPPHDRSKPGDPVSRGQEARLFLFDIADNTIDFKGPPRDGAVLHASIERHLARAFEAVLNSVSHEELDVLARGGVDRFSWDEHALDAFAQVKDKLAAKAEALAQELLPEAPKALYEARMAAETPPLQLPGGGSPEMVTGRQRGRRGPG